MLLPPSMIKMKVTKEGGKFTEKCNWNGAVTSMVEAMLDSNPNAISLHNDACKKQLIIDSHTKTTKGRR